MWVGMCVCVRARTRARVRACVRGCVGVCVCPVLEELTTRHHHTRLPFAGISQGMVCELSEPIKRTKYTPPLGLHWRCSSLICRGGGYILDSERLHEVIENPFVKTKFNIIAHAFCSHPRLGRPDNQTTRQMKSFHMLP